MNKRLEEFVKKVRKERGLRQKDLAKRLGVSPQFICNAENSGAVRYPVRMLPKIARVLKENLYELVVMRVDDVYVDICEELKGKF